MRRSALLLALLLAVAEGTDPSPEEKAAKRRSRGRRKTRKAAYAEGGSWDRDPAADSTWNIPVVSQIINAKDDFSVLGISAGIMPTEEMVYEARRARMFSLHTDLYDGATEAAGWYTTQAHLKLHAAVDRMLKHPAIVEDWAGAKKAGRKGQGRTQRYQGPMKGEGWRVEWEGPQSRIPLPQDFR